MRKNANEVQSIMDEQARNDAQNVQLDESDSESSDSDEDDQNVQIHVNSAIHSKIPHEGDTEDIAVDVSPDNYDHRHSKQWN
jgi:uroporphyrinogen-III decarboxylase